MACHFQEMVSSRSAALIQHLKYSALHRGAFCQFLFRWIDYCHSSKTTRKETGKTHPCALTQIPRIFKQLLHTSERGCHLILNSTIEEKYSLRA